MNHHAQKATPEQELRLEAMRKMYEHEPMLSPEERARHIEIETARIMGEKPTTKVSEMERANLEFGLHVNRVLTERGRK